MEIYDVLIIGGGPAGMYSAFYSGLRELKVKIVEAQPYLGGKMQLYSDKIIWDLGGHPPTLACKLIDQIIQQGLTFNPTLCLNEKITSIEKQDELFVARSNKTVHYAKTIIIAIGSGIFTPQKLSVFDTHHKNVHYTLKPPRVFQGKNIVISGNGISAFDWANALSDIAQKITVITSEQDDKIIPIVDKHLMNKSIEILTNTSIVQVVENNDKHIISLTCEHLGTKKKSQILVDEVLINLGYEKDFTLLSNCHLPIQMQENSFISGQPNGTTTVPGLFAAGDIIKHNAKLNLITGAFQDAANTVNEVKQYLDPKARKTAMVSTHNTKFKERNEAIRKTLR
jgi:ferredoxin/flavodoxin---NADP+ reductase